MNACATWDFRINSDGLDHTVVLKQLRLIAKKFCFQLEQGEQTGYKHYQGRMSLIKKHRKSELLSLYTLHSPPNYLEPTLKDVMKNNDYMYVTKHETRIAGPWDDKITEKYIPRQYRDMIDKLYPFQKYIYESANIFDKRHINMIYDPRGNVGKSTIAAICELYGDGIDLPPVNDAERLIQSACDICEAKQTRSPSPIFIDLPRAMNKERLNGIYTAIEQIKKGKLFDLRYKYREWWIDSPQIWVFSNIAPDLELLSRDRWLIWKVNNLNELVKYEVVDDDDSSSILSKQVI